MNYRDYKQFARGTVHHIYNRGVNKGYIFFDSQDYLFFTARLRENIHPKVTQMVTIKGAPDGHHLGAGGASLVAEAHTPYIRKVLPPNSFTLLSYILMPNHFHLEIRQEGDLPVGKLISKVCTSYGKYINKKYDRVGSLFQDTFKGILIDNDSYLLWLSAYIHNNPKVAGLVTDLKDYPWGSYLDYAGLRSGTLCNKDLILSQFKDVSGYRKFVNEATEKIIAIKGIKNYLLD